MIMPQELRSAAATRRWAPYVETLALTLVVLAANFLLFRSSPGYFGWSFNPYLFVVLVIAGRYGLLPGLWAALVCLAAYLGTLIVLYIGVPITLIVTPPHYGLLVTFSLGAFIVGNLADRSRDRLAQALTLHDEVRLRHDRLSSQFTLLSDEKHLLDKQVLSEEETFPALVAMFEELDHLDPDEIPPRIVRFAPRLLGGGRAALYAVEGTETPGATLLRVATDGTAWVQSVAAGHPVLRRALEDEGAATIAQVAGLTDVGAPDAAEGRGGASGAVPDASVGRGGASGAVQLGCRLSRAEGSPQLVLLMSDLPFAAFAPSRLAALHSAMQVAGRALGRAALFKVTQDRNVEDPITRACTTTYFNKRLEEEYAIAARHKMPLSVLTVQVPGLEQRVRKEQHARLRQVLASAFQESLRNGDLLAHHERPGSFLVLCPFTPVEGAEVVARRLRERVAKMIRQPDVAEGAARDVHVLVLAVEPKRTPLAELKRSIRDSLVPAGGVS
jgi:GGDEF domain-containing protein